VLTSQPASTARVIAAARERGVDINVVHLQESTRTAHEAAAAVGAQVGQIVKSLIFVADGAGGVTPFIVLVSGSNLADLGALAAFVGEESVRRATADEARAATGFAIGGIPPFGHSKRIRTLMDPDLLRYETVWAAAGTGNSVFPTSPASLRDLARAEVAAVARPAQPATEVPPR
jgi:prolyl-tRNA editing enzyme YbaK/EbsC (Cys-tRNA(Pro) deacylase)